MAATSSLSGRGGPSNRAERRWAAQTLGRAGLLAALSPLVVPALERIHATSGVALVAIDGPVRLGLSLVVAAILLIGALILARQPSWGRALIVVAAIGLGTLGTLDLHLYPARAMAWLITIVVTTAWIYFAPETEEVGHTLSNSRLARARMSAIGTICAVLTAVAFRLSAAPTLGASLLASLLVTLGLAAHGLPSRRLRDVFVPILALASVAAAVALEHHPELAAVALLPAPVVLVLGLGGRMERHAIDARADLGDLLLEQPARMLVGSFLGVGLIGAVGLSLPSSSAAAPVELLDALFTAFSAICVTGLAVLDTGTDYSIVGQVMILVLIQLGGLGIMSFSTAAMVLLGQRLSLRHEGAVAELIGGDRRASLGGAIKRMLLITAVSEALGAVALTLLFHHHGDAWSMAGWRGLFTAISAYCNAGFALQSDSLVGYQGRALVLHVVGLLIILGGLGPAVVAAIPHLRRRSHVHLHARIVLLTTSILLVVPFALLAALEWNHSLASLDVGARLHNAWFQSLTTRTAGFNSVDFAAMSPATRTLIEVLMFIGGSPGSTAGGIKTTTAFVMILAIVSVARARDVLVWDGWTIPRTTVYRAAAVTTLGATSVVLGVFAMQLTQAMDTEVIVFEVISALGTVGLSIGGTAELDDVGKLIITVCMFVGRVAPLTVFLIFSRAQGHDRGWTFPEQDVSVG